MQLDTDGSVRQIRCENCASARAAALEEAAKWHDTAARNMREDNSYWGGPSTWERSIIEDHQNAAAQFRDMAKR